MARDRPEDPLRDRNDRIVPVQPETESGRFPLVDKFRPSGGDFQGMGSTDPMCFWEERER